MQSAPCAEAGGGGCAASRGVWQPSARPSPVDAAPQTFARAGYRRDATIHRAALNEAAAAGLLLSAGWHLKCGDDGAAALGFTHAFTPPKVPWPLGSPQTLLHSLTPPSPAPAGAPLSAAIFADPLCGSGTFLIEACLIAGDAAPGLLRPRDRPWPFEGWHDFEAAAWREALGEAEAARRDRRWRGVALGNDIHEVCWGGALRGLAGCVGGLGDGQGGKGVELRRFGGGGGGGGARGLPPA
jgi:hypothetical protein